MSEAVQEFIDFVSEEIKHIGLREGLVGQARANNLSFAWEMAARYLASDDGARLDIEAFHMPMSENPDGPTAAQHVLTLKAQEPKRLYFVFVKGLAEVDPEDEVTCDACGGSVRGQEVIVCLKEEHGREALLRHVGCE